MKKILFLIITVVSFFNFSFSQVFSEDWSGSMSGWTQVDGDGDGFVWTNQDLTGAGTPIDAFGKTIVSTSVDISTGTPLNPDNYLFKSTPINLTTLQGNTFLLFDAAVSQGFTGVSENITIYYSTTPPTTSAVQMASNISSGIYQQIAIQNLTIPNSIQLQVIDLTALQGQTIYLIFRHQKAIATSQSAVFIDNIKVVNSDFLASNLTACIGGPVTFTNTSQYNNAGVTITWNFGGGNGNTTGNQEIATFSAPGSYTVQQLINGIPMRTQTMTVVNSPTPTVNVTYPTPACSPLEVTLTTGPGSGYEYSFSDGVKIPVPASSNSVTRILTTPGVYDVYLVQTIDASCIGWDSITGIGAINVLPSPVASFEATSQNLDMMYPSVSFVNTSTGSGLTYDWDFGDTSVNESVLSPTHLYELNKEGSYDVKLYVTSDVGCKDSMEMTIIVEEAVLFFIPNAFTPNGDEFNNTFKPVMVTGYDPTAYNLMIFNRWGELVFESNDPEIGWDGDYGAGNGVIETQTFTYKLKFNSSKNDEVRTVIGSVILMK